MKRLFENQVSTTAKINLTPIIDVALVLVIILLITAPMLSVADLEVDLPSARSRDTESAAHISVTVSRAGEIAVDDVVVAGLEYLAPVLGERVGEAGADASYVVVRADAGLSHAFVREVLDVARNSGAGRIGVATRQKVGGGS